MQADLVYCFHAYFRLVLAFLFGGCFGPRTVREVGAVERTDQMLDARHAEDEMHAAIARQTKAARLSSGAESPVVQNTVNIDRIKFIAVCDQKNAKLVERIEELTVYGDTAVAKAEKIKSSNQEKAAEAAAIIADLIARQAAAIHYLNTTIKEGLEMVKEGARAATLSSEITQLRVDLMTIWKELNSKQVKEFLDYTRKFNQTSSSLGRSMVDKSKRVVAEIAKSPLFVSMMESLDTPTITNCSTSIFEAKGGLRPALLAVDSRDEFDKMATQPIVRKAMRTIHQALASGTTACLQHLEGGKPVLKRFEEIVLKVTGQEVRSKCPLPKAGWADKIFQMEIFGTGSMYANVMLLPYGMMSCAVMLEGTCCFLGLPFEQVDGATLKEKRNTFLRYTVDDLKKAVQPARGGWYAKFVDGICDNGETTIVIPSGHLIAVAGCNARYLRWPLVADAADTARAKSALRSMLQSFPELADRGTANVDLANFLGCPP